jgi:hypothetical protein
MAVYIAGGQFWTMVKSFLPFAIILYVVFVPFGFGYVVGRLLKPHTHWWLWAMMIMPVASHVVEELSYKIQTGWAPSELPLLANIVMAIQASCVLLGGYISFLTQNDSDSS